MTLSSTYAVRCLVPWSIVQPESVARGLPGLVRLGRQASLSTTLTMYCSSPRVVSCKVYGCHQRALLRPAATANNRQNARAVAAQPVPCDPVC